MGLLWFALFNATQINKIWKKHFDKKPATIWLVTTTALNTKISKVRNKILHLSGWVKKNRLGL